MQPSTARDSGQVDPRRSTTDIPPPQSAALGLHDYTSLLITHVLLMYVCYMFFLIKNEVEVSENYNPGHPQCHNCQQPERSTRPRISHNFYPANCTNLTTIYKNN